jgi:hypothetical protein
MGALAIQPAKSAIGTKQKFKLYRYQCERPLPK